MTPAMIGPVTPPVPHRLVNVTSWRHPRAFNLVVTVETRGRAREPPTDRSGWLRRGGRAYRRGATPRPA